MKMPWIQRVKKYKSERDCFKLKGKHFDVSIVHVIFGFNFAGFLNHKQLISSMNDFY